MSEVDRRRFSQGRRFRRRDGGRAERGERRPRDGTRSRASREAAAAGGRHALRLDAVHRLQGVRGGLQGGQRDAGRDAADAARLEREHLGYAPRICPAARSTSSRSIATARRSRRTARTTASPSSSGIACTASIPPAFRSARSPPCSKDPVTGIVTYDPDACIGCRYCVYACPFGVPQYDFNNPFGKIAKCQFCSHLQKQGKIPACCDVCPTGASLFGKVTDLSQEIERRLAAAPGSAYAFPRGRLGDDRPPNAGDDPDLREGRLRRARGGRHPGALPRRRSVRKARPASPCRRSRPPRCRKACSTRSITG